MKYEVWNDGEIYPCKNQKSATELAHLLGCEVVTLLKGEIIEVIHYPKSPSLIEKVYARRIISNKSKKTKVTITYKQLSIYDIEGEKL